MARSTTAFQKALDVASGLSALDKIRLMERLASMLEDDLSVAAGESPQSLEDVTPERMTMKDLIAWLDTNPPPEPWGDLRDDEDAAEYVHRMRRQSTVWLDEPGENE